MATADELSAKLAALQTEFGALRQLRAAAAVACYVDNDAAACAALGELHGEIWALQNAIDDVMIALTRHHGQPAQGVGDAEQRPCLRIVEG
jgi:hypothetical protein